MEARNPRNPSPPCDPTNKAGPERPLRLPSFWFGVSSQLNLNRHIGLSCPVSPTFCHRAGRALDASSTGCRPPTNTATATPRPGAWASSRSSERTGSGPPAVPTKASAPAPAAGHYDHVRFQFRPGRRAEAGLAVHRQPSSGARLVQRWHRGGEVLDLPERVAPGPPWSTRPMRRSSHCTAHRPVSTAVPSPLTHVFRDVGRILTACSRQDAQGLRLQRHDATRCGWRRRGLAGMRWRACRLADAGCGRSGGTPRHRSTRAEE